MVDYKVKFSSRSRKVSLSVRQDMQVFVTIPKFLKNYDHKGFVNRYTSWILEKLEILKNLPQVNFPANNKSDYKKQKQAALNLAKTKVEHWNKFYNFKYSSITIRNQKTRWGSCSKKGNLNFNYRIIHLRENILDYLIVHELCHLKELNHSKNFWRLVALTIPDFKKRKKELAVLH